MNSSFRRIAVLGLVLGLGILLIPADTTLAADPPRGFTSIFNGTDFSGWKLPEGDGGHWKILDGVIDYKSENVEQRLGELCPKGINVFFDNVGGDTLEAVLNHLAIGARIAICGAISAYNAETPPPGPRNYSNLIVYRAKMQGFLVLDYVDRFPEVAAQIAQWVGEGKIKYQVDMQQGLENAPATLQRLFSGKNRGKQLLRLADAPLGGEPS